MVAIIMAHQVLFAALAVDLINLAMGLIPGIQSNSIVTALLNAVLSGLNAIKNAVTAPAAK
jgi:hypothetical protein